MLCLYFWNLSSKVGERCVHRVAAGCSSLRFGVSCVCRSDICMLALLDVVLCIVACVVQDVCYVVLRGLVFLNDCVILVLCW